MGNGVSGIDGIDDGLKKQAKKALNGLEEDQAAEIINDHLQKIADDANGLEDEDEGPDFSILFIKKSSGFSKMVAYDSKKEAKQRYKKLKDKNATVIMLKGSEVYQSKIHAKDIRKVAFLIGCAFGKGWSNLGPMADTDSEWCIFPEADEEDDAEDADGDSDEEDEDDFVLIKCAHGGDGVRIKEFKKKKKAVNKFRNLREKGDMSIVVKGGEIFKCADPENSKQGAQVCFLIGCAFGRDLIDEGNLGPITEDGNELEILEDNDPDSDDE